jgi:hypothetical protein
LLGNTRRFVADQEDVVGVNAGERFRHFRPRRAERDERFVGRGGERDLFGLDDQEILQRGGQLLHPRLRLGGEGVEQLRGRRRRADGLLWEARQRMADDDPREDGRLADAVARSDRDPALAFAGGGQDLLLLLVRLAAETSRTSSTQSFA